MTIKRAKRKHSYTVVDNKIINDERLSMKARGLLIYMLSKPDDWVFYETQMTKAGPDGRDSIRSGIKEIEQAGYLVRDPIERDSTGKFKSKSWTLYDEPKTDNPRTENPSTENPTSDNPTLLSTKELSTDKQSTDRQTTDYSKDQPPQQTDPGTKANAMKTWERVGFGMITPFIIDSLQHWIKDFDGNEDVITKAIEEAAKSNPRAPLKYTEGILKQWLQRGIKTVSDVDAEHAKHEKTKEATPEDEAWAKQNAEALNF